MYTDFRPTPLEHYIFPTGGDGIFLAYDKDNKFREDNFLKAVNAIAPASDGFASSRTASRTAAGDGDGGGGRGLHSFRFQLNLRSSVHRVIQVNS